MVGENDDGAPWLTRAYMLDFLIKPSAVCHVKSHKRFGSQTCHPFEVGESQSQEVKMVGVQLGPQCCTE
jgi:hypothetical protein